MKRFWRTLLWWTSAAIFLLWVVAFSNVLTSWFNATDHPYLLLTVLTVLLITFMALGFISKDELKRKLRR
jgi:membrane protein YdbS with pleckstrin-like domain